MTKSRKVRRNILKKKVNKTIHVGGNGAIEDIINKLSGLKTACRVPGAITAFRAFRARINTFLPTLQIPTKFDSLLNKILGTETTMKDLFADILNTLECKDIDTIAAILPQVLLFDEIGKLLEKADFSTLDETTKNGYKIYANLKAIINKPENQDLLCAILNKMESNNHIKPEHKMAFIKLFGGSEEICKGMLSKFGDSMKSTIGSFFGSKSGDNANPETDTRCGENLLVKTSWFSGDYCTPKSKEAPAPAEKEGETAPVADGTTTPVKPAEKEEASAPDETNPPATDGKDQTQPPAPDETNPPATDGKDQTQPPATEKKGWLWGGKYKRVKHTKKSKKTKSKKSKRSKK